FFQGKSHREVGQALGVSEDLARKRVERVLEKLRAAFSRRGLRLTSAALAEAVTVHSVQAAPVGLSAELAKYSFTHAGAGSLANPAGPILLLAMKTKIVAILAILLLGLCFFGAWHYYHAKGLALSAGTVTATNPSGSIAKSGTSADKTNPPAQVVLPVAAATPASASGTVNVTSPSLDAAIASFLKLSAAGDYYSLIQNYMYIPAKGNKNAPETGPEVDEAAQIAANDPQIRAALDLFAKLLAQVKDTTPVFSPDGRVARLPLADGSANVVLRQIDTGAWYISGTEMIQPSDSPSAPTPGPKNTDAAPASNSPKHNAGPGGYVP
ncbi:MAG TPA: hypothetical protein VHC95_07385, partial [Opitutales bacterium]|nr:hypothetical protein [Opitutales bacterium]